MKLKVVMCLTLLPCCVVGLTLPFVRTTAVPAILSSLKPDSSAHHNRSGCRMRKVSESSNAPMPVLTRRACSLSNCAETASLLSEAASICFSASVMMVVVVVAAVVVVVAVIVSTVMVVAP